MADTNDDFNITEYFNDAPMDEEIKAKIEKRAEKLKRKQLSKEEKEEKVIISNNILFNLCICKKLSFYLKLL